MTDFTPTNGIKELCKALGSEYTIRVIDGENIIYRELDNGFSFEISNADHNRETLNASLYIWNSAKHFIEESIHGIKTLPALRDALENSVVKYSSLDPMLSKRNDPCNLRLPDQNSG